MKMERTFEQLPDLFPEPLKFAVAILLRDKAETLEELRFRQGHPTCACYAGREVPLRYREEEIPVDGELLSQIVKRASGFSAYAVQEQLQRGFLSLPNGHRLGVCGTAVQAGGKVQTFKDIQALNLRLARPIHGVAAPAMNLIWSHPCSTLIAGCPGSGKTTVLRDMIRQLSDRFNERVGVVDERGELAACRGGMPQFKVGRCTDVLTFCPKREGIEILLRTMRPQWIALDEITSEQDTEAILRASYCGVRFLATVHVWQKEDLWSRPVYRSLIDTGLFENLILLRPDRSLVCQRIAPHDRA